MKLSRILSILLTCLILTGCAGGNPGISDFTPSEDRKLVIYTSHKEAVYQSIIREFEERTGIWVELVNGGTYDMLDQLRAEQDAPKADIMFGGGSDSLEAYEDCFTPYVSPNLQYVLPEYQCAENCWTPFTLLPVVLIYNTKLISPEELTGWEDLTRHQFQGKISFGNPASSGSTFTALMTYRQVLGDESLSLLAQALDGYQADTSGAVLTDVASGVKAVGITLESTALQRIEQGSNIGIIYPREGTTCVPDGVAIVKNAAHLENAQRFLDFALSYEVQSLLETTSFRRSARTDIPAKALLQPLSEIPQLSYNSHTAALLRSSVLSRWESLMEEVAGK